MILLLDIGNTNTHLGFARSSRVVRKSSFPTACWNTPDTPVPLLAAATGRALTGVAFCSVVPGVVPAVEKWLKAAKLDSARLTSQSLTGLEFRYPQPETLGADRLANVLAAVRLYHKPGVPLVCIDFGTAVTVDAVDAHGRFIGGIIAPGIAALRDYLREKTAQLPQITLARPRRFIGRGTREAMQVGCVRGFEGMMRELIQGARRELGTPPARVIATGGYARLMARSLSEIDVVHPDLALEGLHLFWHEQRAIDCG